MRLKSRYSPGKQECRARKPGRGGWVESYTEETSAGWLLLRQVKVTRCPSGNDEQRGSTACGGWRSLLK